jgi:hypothetical protein
VAPRSAYHGSGNPASRSYYDANRRRTGGINVERSYSCVLTVGAKLRQDIVFLKNIAQRTIIALTALRDLAH